MTRYYVIDREAQMVCVETNEVIAEAIATEVGGDYIEVAE
jgi:hypothetical protein